MSISVKATVENSRVSVKKLSPKESIEGAHTVLRGSVRAPKGFFKGKPEANSEGALTLTLSTVWAPKGLLRRQFFHTAPRIFHTSPKS